MRLEEDLKREYTNSKSLCGTQASSSKTIIHQWVITPWRCSTSDWSLNSLGDWRFEVWFGCHLKQGESNLKLTIKLRALEAISLESRMRPASKWGIPNKMSTIYNCLSLHDAGFINHVASNFADLYWRLTNPSPLSSTPAPFLSGRCCQRGKPLWSRRNSVSAKGVLRPRQKVKPRPKRILRAKRRFRTGLKGY